MVLFASFQKNLTYFLVIFLNITNFKWCKRAYIQRWCTRDRYPVSKLSHKSQDLKGLIHLNIPLLVTGSWWCIWQFVKIYVKLMWKT